ncbi:group 1 truncated hemoglobin [Permianibacter sp. IMCC34836]|uniref:group I truncated hemoglobin n=1 Tax=Permianibacter fluminis TaxID=2738515 RepID=UPI0015529B6D|nr:group 1 truncated hemoglobin [Permianibacter fluminis]NQD36503.1 group 1 truncated hemoglobin [Permianibacter fluminis]
MNRLSLFALLFCTAVASDTRADDSLYTRIGGLPVLQKITSRLVDRSSTEPVTKRSFNKVNLDRVKEKLAEQFCVLAGGPCTYTGDDMKLVHQGLNISEREFYGLVEQLRQVLDSEGIGSREKNELLALLAPMKPQVVHQPTEP